jgi:MFS family permease
MNGPAVTARVYTSQFWLLCLCSFLFFASFNMLIPELPGFLTQMGGADYKGLIIALFTVTAMVSRPFSGKLADRIGRIPVMAFGAIVCFVCGFLYPVLISLAGFFLLRLVHGFSTGFTPTGATAYISDIVPVERRGEAMGIVGTAGTLGMASGPAIGGVIGEAFSLTALFYTSSVLALASVALLIGMKETLPARQRFAPSMLRIRRTDLFEPRVIIPCLVMLLTAYSYGAVYTLMPDFGEVVGIRNKGLLFTYFTVASLVVRLVAGKASDIYGRPAILRVSTVMMMIAMITIAFADARWPLILGVTLYGLAQGMTSPTLLAWATDLSDEQHKGRGVSSLYIFMEFGIFLGAIISGFLYANEPARFVWVFGLSAVLNLVAFAYLFHRTRHPAQA